MATTTAHETITAAPWATLRRAVALVGLALVLAFYAEVLAHAPVTGQDFRNFYAAATVLHGGGNPYDIHQFVAAAERLYHPTMASQRAALAGNPYVQGPPLAAALLPFVGRPPAALYRIYAAIMVAAAAVALALLARLWPAKGSPWRIVVLLSSPVTFLCILLGQPDPLLLLALALALWWLDRDHPAAAGCVLALGLIKPQIMAGPIVLLAVLAWRRRRLKAYALGVVAGAAVFVGVSLLVTGPDVVRGWIGELIGFSGATVYTQVDISSLTTLYVGWAPHALALALSGAVLVAWSVACVWLWRDRVGGWDEQWWLATTLVLWLLATPYAHPHDDVLLLPAAWYVLADRCARRAPYRGTTLLAVLLFAAWWLLPMTSVLGLRPPLVRGLGIIPITLLAALLLLRQPGGDPDSYASKLTASS